MVLPLYQKTPQPHRGKDLPKWPKLRKEVGWVRTCFERSRCSSTSLAAVPCALHPPTPLPAIFASRRYIRLVRPNLLHRSKYAREDAHSQKSRSESFGFGLVASARSIFIDLILRMRVHAVCKRKIKKRRRCEHGDAGRAREWMWQNSTAL